MGPTEAGPICAEYKTYLSLQMARPELTTKKVRGLLWSLLYPYLLRTRLCRTGAASSTVKSSGGLQCLYFTNADFLHLDAPFVVRKQESR
jgi:hypothetical protein